MQEKLMPNDGQWKALVASKQLEIDKLKRDLAFKKEELQALYMEYKNKSNLLDNLQKEKPLIKNVTKFVESSK